MSDQVIAYIMITIAGIATGIGALPVYITTEFSQRALDTLLGFAAGVMLAATSFSLILPSIELGGGENFKTVGITSVGILFGAFAIYIFDKLIPHIHPADMSREGVDSSAVTGIWLFVIAIALHNFPEGLATGVGFGTGNINDGISIATGIALQNFPEGLAVAVALINTGYSKNFSVFVSFLTGLIEPVGALLGMGLVKLFSPILGFILASAAGTMLYVISDEIIPATHAGGYETEATFGLIVGFVLMLFLDVAIG